jgi:outer membrane protein assembly factor BamB
MGAMTFGLLSGCLQLQREETRESESEQTPNNVSTNSPSQNSTPDNSKIDDTTTLSPATNWEFEAGAPLTQPAVGTEHVFVGSFDQTLYAFDIETGEESWRVGPRNFDSSTYELGSPTLIGDSVYVNTDEEVLKINSRTGEILSSIRDNGYSDHTVVTPELVVMPNREGRITAYNSIGGSVVWESDLKALGKTYNPIVGDDVIVFANVSDYVDSPDADRDRDTRVVGLSRDTGEKIWRFIPERFIGKSVGVGYAIQDDTVAVVDDGGFVFGLSANDGSVQWTQTMGLTANGNIAPQPVGFAGQFLIASGEISSIDPQSGDILWSTSLDAGHISSRFPVDDEKAWIPNDGGLEFSGIASIGRQGENIVEYDFSKPFTQIPSVRDKRIYVSHTDDTLRAYNNLENLR